MRGRGFIDLFTQQPAGTRFLATAGSQATSRRDTEEGGPMPNLQAFVAGERCETGARLYLRSNILQSDQAKVPVPHEFR
jgi:hypothetical protein